MYACVLCVCICVQKLYVQWILYVIVRAADTSYASVSLSCHNLLGYTNPMCVCVHVYYIPFVFILVWRIMQLVWIRNNDNRSIEVRASATWMEWMILAPIHQSTLFVLFECVVCVCVCVRCGATLKNVCEHINAIMKRIQRAKSPFLHWIKNIHTIDKFNMCPGANSSKASITATFLLQTRLQSQKCILTRNIFIIWFHITTTVI